MIRVLIVDDQAFARRGIGVLLEENDDITVAGEAASGPEAIEAVRQLHPDVVLMDVRMPDGDGISAARVISAGPDRVPVILITTFDLDEYIFAGLEAEVAGFLLKTATPEELAAAVRAAHRGGAVIDPTVAPRAIHEFARRQAVTANEDAANLLSGRERQVVEALAHGLKSNADIGEHLHLAPGTVKAHMTRIMNKVGVRSRSDLVAWAFRNHIVS